MSGAEIFYNNTERAVFVRRLNRFVAEVEVGGREERVHVKNTGRLGELLLPGAAVTLQRADAPGRKTAYDLISVWKEGLQWVNIDSLAPNELMKRLLLGADYDLVKPEYTYGDSRFDFYMERKGERCLREVKGCTLAADLEQVEKRSLRENGESAPAEPGRRIGLFANEPAGTGRRIGLFPDAPTGMGRKVGLFPDAPTERGVKHLDELAVAAREGYRCSVAFVIQMNGIGLVLPNLTTHPAFGLALRRAAEAGVRVFNCRCRVEADRIGITGVSDETERYLEET